MSDFHARMRLQPGAIVRRLFESKDIPEPDPRQDVLMAVGIVLGDQEKVDLGHMRIGRQDDKDEGMRAYYVLDRSVGGVMGNVVFMAIYYPDGLVYHKYLPGPWQRALFEEMDRVRAEQKLPPATEASDV